MADEFDLTDYALCSYSVGGGARSAGLAIDGRVIALAAFAELDLDAALMLRSNVFGMLQQWERAWPQIQRAAAAFRSGPRAAYFQAMSAPAEAVRLHEPVETPGTIYCGGSNYRKHVIDLMLERFKPPGHEAMTPEQLRALAEKNMDERKATGEPFYFNKNGLALNGPFDDIPVPRNAKEVDWELELAVVIGKKAWCVSRDEALDHVAGYAVSHDVSTRDRMLRPGAVGADFIQGKGLKGFFPFGPYVVPKAFVPDPQDLRLQLKLNGEVKQDASTNDMIFDIPRLIEYLSQWVPLMPGDILTTGSPAGNGSHYNRYLRPGDVVEGSITGLGAQRNRMVEEARPA